LNSITHINGQSYFCLKTGKKMVWSKPATGSQSATPNKQSTPTQPSKSTNTNAPTNPTPTSFSDLFQNRAGLAHAVWAKMSAAQQTTPRELPPVEIYRGPHTPTYVKSPQDLMKIDLQLFPNAELPKKVVIIYWTHGDMGWATDKATSLMGAADMQNFITEAGGPFVDCYTPTSCDVGHAYIGSDGTAYMGIGVPDNIADVGSNAADHLAGQTEIVEFYHALEIYPYFLNKHPFVTNHGRTSDNFPPQWMAIGSENMTNETLPFNPNEFSLTASLNNRGCFEWINVEPTTEWLTNYLNISNLGGSWSDDGYISVRTNGCLGLNLMESFVALKGPSVMIDFPNLMSQGQSFPQAFQSEFGVSWQEAVPELVKVIRDKYLNRY
jgi:hypothetical protein